MNRPPDDRHACCGRPVLRCTAADTPWAAAMKFGRDLCPHCRADVLRLPTDEGPQTFDAAEFAIGDVKPEDRFVVRAHRHMTKVVPGRPPPATCVRVHRCTDEEPPATTATHPATTPPSRTDFAAVRRLDTLIHLYRGQQLGTLRQHSGQRTYEPVTVASRLAAIARLSADSCPLCRRPLSNDTEAIVVGTVEADSPYSLRACLPDCQPRRRETH